MRTIEFKSFFGSNHTIKLFDSIKELTSERVHDLNKLSLQDVEIGSDMDAVAAHFSRLGTMLVAKKNDEALQEAKNLHNNIYYQIEKINIKSLCFSVYVHQIDGEFINDFSIDGAMKTIKRCSQIGLKHSQVEDILDELKKKLQRSFEPTFLINTGIVEQ